MSAQTPVCEVVDLVKHFGPVRAVDGVSLRVDPGKVVALVGESGSGKSTVGRLIVRLLEPTAGSVHLAGSDVSHLSRRALRPHRRKVSIVFQDPASSLDPRLTVGRIVAEPLRLHGESDKTRRQQVEEMLEKVGLRRSVAERYPHELSGGQRQRVSIARALVSNPSLLVADEPTSALDVSVQASVLNLLADLQRDLGFACLFITHDLSAVEYLADEVAVMYLGKLAERGTRDADLRLAPPPLHAGAALRGAGCRPVGAALAQPRRPHRRHPQSDRSTVRLPLPHPLSGRGGPLHAPRCPDLLPKGGSRRRLSLGHRRRQRPRRALRRR